LFSLDVRVNVFSFVWVWILVCDIKWRMYTEVIWKQVDEKNIWTKEGCINRRFVKII
jgi:hypothetical protein